MAGISCRSSDRKKPKKYHKKPKKTEKYRKTGKKPKKTEEDRKNRTLPQISNLGLVFFGFFSGFFGLQPPHILISGTRAVDQFANFIISFVCNSNFSFKIFVISNQKNLYNYIRKHHAMKDSQRSKRLQVFNYLHK